mgnify:CR=1 FL=1
MTFQDYFPVWDKLNLNQQNKITAGLITKKIKKGTVNEKGSMFSTGLLLNI